MALVHRGEPARRSATCRNTSSVDHSKLTARVRAHRRRLTDVPYPVQMEPNLVIEFYSR